MATRKAAKKPAKKAGKKAAKKEVAAPPQGNTSGERIQRSLMCFLGADLLFGKPLIKPMF